jgi:hypothetical protein
MNHEGSERERFLLVLFYGVLLLIGYLAFRVVGPFLAPLVWAAVFAMVLNPVQAAWSPASAARHHDHDRSGVFHRQRSPCSPSSPPR